jgi:ferredoxin
MQSASADGKTHVQIANKQNTNKRRITMKATIDRDGCIGCGVCADTCPEVFRMADDGLAEVYAEVTSETLASAREAEESCPVSVITVEE